MPRLEHSQRKYVSVCFKKMYVCFKKIGFSFICVLVFFKNTLQLAFTKILKSTLIFMLNSTLNCGHTFLRYQSLCPLFSENLRYIKFKNLDKIAITTNVYLYKHCQKTKTLCRHFSRFPTFTA